MTRPTVHAYPVQPEVCGSAAEPESRNAEPLKPECFGVIGARERNGTAGIDPSGLFQVHQLRAEQQVWKLIWLGIIFLTLAIPALAVDRTLAQWCVLDYLPDLPRKTLDACEPFGDALTNLIIMIAIAIIVPVYRRALIRVGTITLGAGILANVVKYLIPRLRPREFDLSLPILESFFADSADMAGDPSSASFPSGHTAAAVGFAIGLSWLWPEGRYLFWTVAALVACQRMEAGAHFLSDVLVAAGIGCLVAAACFSSRLLGPVFRWAESSGGRADSLGAPRGPAAQQ